MTKRSSVPVWAGILATLAVASACGGDDDNNLFPPSDGGPSDGTAGGSAAGGAGGDAGASGSGASGGTAGSSAGGSAGSGASGGASGDGGTSGSAGIAGTSGAAGASGSGAGGSGGASGSSGASGSGGGGCSCDDGVSCTLDECIGDACLHRVGPNTGPTACPSGTYCDLDMGCVPGVVCSNQAQCDAAFGSDACKVNVRCDGASATCKFDVLDNDMDTYPPIVCGGGDCNDADDLVYPGAPEVCNGRSDDCDATIDEGATCGPLQACTSGACSCRPENTCGASCVDKQVSIAHCGGCNQPCPAGASCVAGACVCPSGLSRCGNECVDLATDERHCGSCPVQCGGSFECVAGSCVCPTGLTDCFGQCTNTDTDPQNCGFCGNSCAACAAGSCVTCTPPVMILLHDQSGSMSSSQGATGTRFSNSVSGVQAFLGQSPSATVQFGLQYHPVTPECMASSYAPLAVPVAAMPGVGAAISASYSTHGPTGLSVFQAPLTSVLTQAQAVAQARPASKVAVVMLTDGIGNSCTGSDTVPGTAAAAAAAFSATPSVRTYIVGIDSSNTADWNTVAAAGGTTSARLTNSAATVTSALAQIRGELLTCP